MRRFGSPLLACSLVLLGASPSLAGTWSNVSQRVAVASDFATQTLVGQSTVASGATMIGLGVTIAAGATLGITAGFPLLVAGAVGVGLCFGTPNPYGQTGTAGGLMVQPGGGGLNVPMEIVYGSLSPTGQAMVNQLTDPEGGNIANADLLQYVTGSAQGRAAYPTLAQNLQVSEAQSPNINTKTGDYIVDQNQNTHQVNNTSSGLNCVGGGFQINTTTWYGGTSPSVIICGGKVSNSCSNGQVQCTTVWYNVTSVIAPLANVPLANVANVLAGQGDAPTTFQAEQPLSPQFNDDITQLMHDYPNIIHYESVPASATAAAATPAQINNALNSPTVAANNAATSAAAAAATAAGNGVTAAQNALTAANANATAACSGSGSGTSACASANAAVASAQANLTNAQTTAAQTAATAAAANAAATAAANPTPVQTTQAPGTDSSSFAAPGAPSAYANSGIASTIDFGARTTKFMNDMKASPLFSIGSGIVAGIPSSSTSAYTFNCGRFGTHVFDFSIFSGVFVGIAAMVNILATWAGFKIVTKGGGG